MIRRTLTGGLCALLALAPVAGCAAFRPGARGAGAGRENRPPTVRARCEPCRIEAGKTITLVAEAADPNGDVLTFVWRAAAGELTTPSDRQSVWTAPAEDGPIPITVEVTDPRGGRATDAVTVQVVRPSGTDRLDIARSR